MKEDVRYLEKVLKALANRRRLAIIKYLKRNPDSSVGQIATAIKVSFKATSRHLYVLSAVDLVEREQRRLNMFYRLSPKQPAVSKRLLPLL